MDDDYAPRPLAGWYMPAAIAALIFMGVGCIMYLLQVLADPASMPLDQRAVIEAIPAWVTGAQAVAVWVGLVGALMLAMKRKLAEPLLLISVLAVLAWLAGLLLIADVRENMSANDLIVAMVVAALTWTIFWFARHSRQRNWLR